MASFKNGLSAIGRCLWRLLLLLILSGLCLQLAFALRILPMRWVTPSSTAYQRAQLVQQVRAKNYHWNQSPVAAAALSNHLRRAVIASEDGHFASHTGVEWAAIRQAQQRNAKAAAKSKDGEAKVVGGSTISQQLAKNLFLSGERNLLRKGQELVLTYQLEWLVGKPQILNIYLNNVEWGRGIYGAEAASQFYFHTSAQRLSPAQAARLAVMLPAPKRFERNPDSRYLLRRSRTIERWMRDAQLPQSPSTPEQP